jgi:hypothetical protein
VSFERWMDWGCECFEEPERVRRKAHTRIDFLEHADMSTWAWTWDRGSARSGNLLERVCLRAKIGVQHQERMIAVRAEIIVERARDLEE